MNFDNNLINSIDEHPNLPDLIPIENLDLAPSYIDINSLNDRLT